MKLSNDPEIQAWLAANRKPHGNSRYLTYKDKTLTIKQWSETLGISRDVIWQRLRRGWSVEQTLETPMMANQYSK